ncbi:hypothetical protein MGA3_02530 [Bacillus methanolicus MGA3]|nr:hypothetical protein MGA3_02530 [Bacillus methanolicus MGA3]
MIGPPINYAIIEALASSLILFSSPFIKTEQLRELLPIHLQEFHLDN